MKNITKHDKLTKQIKVKLLLLQTQSKLNSKNERHPRTTTNNKISSKEVITNTQNQEKPEHRVEGEVPWTHC